MEKRLDSAKEEDVTLVMAEDKEGAAQGRGGEEDGRWPEGWVRQLQYTGRKPGDEEDEEGGDAARGEGERRRSSGGGPGGQGTREAREQAGRSEEGGGPEVEARMKVCPIRAAYEVRCA